MLTSSRRRIDLCQISIFRMLISPDARFAQDPPRFFPPSKYHGDFSMKILPPNVSGDDNPSGVCLNFSYHAVHPLLVRCLCKNATSRFFFLSPLNFSSDAVYSFITRDLC